MRLARIVLVCSDPLRLAGFYEATFGFARGPEGVETDPGLGRLAGLPGSTAQTVTLRLSAQEIVLVGFRPPGRSYPADVPGSSPVFQHFAIVVSDMAAAYARLLEQPGWSAISTNGPQVLPASSGGVAAFKFRDPDGHPLEFITRAPGSSEAHEPLRPESCFLQINHSAISVASTNRSVEFYEALGLRRAGGSLNIGIEQDRLDGISGVRVEVTALADPRFTTPHLELLCYADRLAGAMPLTHPNDVAATWLVYTVESAESLVATLEKSGAASNGVVRFSDGCVRALIRDPDGHLLCLEAPG